MQSYNVLLVFPHNFFERKNGVQKRYFEFASWLKGKGFSIDLLGLQNFESSWRNFNAENSNNLINQLMLYNFRIGWIKQQIWYFLSKLKFLPGRQKGQTKIKLPDHAFPGMIALFNKLIEAKKYDFLIIGYVQWAHLIKGIDSLHGKTILTMEDCLSRNIAENHAGMVSVDQLLPEETERVNLFDKVICLSWEEMDCFSKHTTKPEFHYVPVFMNEVESDPEEPKIYDILFVGSENPSNQRGIKWFFNAVYPLLNKELKILCVGKITDFVPEFENVLKVKYVANLEDVYRKSILTFNPLQDGTGMKVKVIESLAYGIPIVSTTLGLSGIKPEVKKLFITADEPLAFAQAIHGLISDKTLYLEYSKVLKKVFIENFTTEVAVKELDKVFCI